MNKLISFGCCCVSVSCAVVATQVQGAQGRHCNAKLLEIPKRSSAPVCSSRMAGLCQWSRGSSCQSDGENVALRDLEKHSTRGVSIVCGEDNKLLRDLV